MKKTLILGLALASALGISAQTSVVKDVENGLKKNDDCEKLLNQIQPALTNPETAELAQTWYVAGRTGLGFYQEAVIGQATGQPFDAEKNNRAAKALLDGFGYLVKALPLDSVADAKGKIKTKYSKDIVKMIRDRHDQLRNAGVMAWEAKDFQNAYDIWDMYLALPNNPVLGKEAPKAAPDTIQGELIWNQAIAMLLSNKNAEALACLEKMPPYGFIPEDYYAYAMNAAQAIGNEEKAIDFAKKGLEAGTNPQMNTGFLATIINYEMSKENYAGAYEYANKALADAPADNVLLQAQLYDILGTISENDNKPEVAKENFKKSFEIDPTFAKGYFNYGRMLYNKCIELDEQITDRAERDAQVVPALKEAATYFEKAYELDDTLDQVPSVLYRLYYRLGPEFEEKSNYWQNIQ